MPYSPSTQKIKKMSNGRGYSEIGPEAPLLNPSVVSSSSHSKLQIFNYIIGGVTAILVLITLVSSFIYHSFSSVSLNVFFSICIIMVCLSNITLMLWYRKQEFSYRLSLIIYFNSIVVILLCLCANLYLHGY